jgi:hypothetical protein
MTPNIIRGPIGDSGITAKEMDDLRRDAERYRWLRDRMAVEDTPEEHPSWSTPSEHESQKFDAAVDAAMNGANTGDKPPRETRSA